MRISEALFSGYQVRKSIRLEAKPLGRSSAAPVFRATECGLGFNVCFNNKSTILVKRRIFSWLPFSRTLFDGTAAMIAFGGEISIAAREDEILEVRDTSGNRWLVGYAFESESLPLFELEELRRLLAPISKSVLSHLALALLALTAFQAPRWIPTLGEYIQKQAGTRIAVIGGGAIGAELPEPFSGASIRLFERAVQEDLAAAEAAKMPAADRTATAVGGLLAKFKLGNLGRPGAGGHQNSKRIDTSSIVASVMKEQQQAALKAPVVPTRVSSPSQPPGSQVSFNKQELMIRQAFDQVRPRLSRAYDEALRIDPNLSLSLDYEVQVNDQGFVSSVKLNAKGKYSAAGLNTLEKGVRDALLEIRVGKEYAGRILRGEQVFMR